METLRKKSLSNLSLKVNFSAQVSVWYVTSQCDLFKTFVLTSFKIAVITEDVDFFIRIKNILIAELFDKYFNVNHICKYTLYVQITCCI